MSENAVMMENLLALALQDPMVRQLEGLYRTMPDRTEGAEYLAVVIKQGAERIGVQWDEAAMVAAIKKYWNAT